MSQSDPTAERAERRKAAAVLAARQHDDELGVAVALSEFVTAEEAARGFLGVAEILLIQLAEELDEEPLVTAQRLAVFLATEGDA